MSQIAFEKSPAFRAVVWRRRLYLFLALVLDLAALAFLACLRIAEPGDAPRGKEILGFDLYFEPFTLRAAAWFAGLVAFQIYLGHRALISALQGETVVELYPEDKSEGKRYGEVTGPEVVALVNELADSLGVRRPDRVLLQTEPVPNAYTGRLFGWGTILVLHSNLLEILPRAQVRAIIAHELGHVRRWDSFVNQLAHIPRSFLILVQMLLLFKVSVGLWHAIADGAADLFFTRLFFLFLAWQLLGLLFGGLQRVANLAMQQAETLADGYAAQACGPEPVVNALLRIGERAEALTALMEALVPYLERLERPPTEAELIRLLHRFPPGEMSAKVARETAAEVLVRDQLLFLREKLLVPLTDEQVERLAAEAAVALRAEEANKPAKERPPQPDPAQEERLLDWHQYDFDRSGNLNAEELARLVAELRRKPEGMIFRQFLQENALWESHPTIRHRLLFLFETFLEHPEQSRATA